MSGLTQPTAGLLQKQGLGYLLADEDAEDAASIDLKDFDDEAEAQIEAALLDALSDGAKERFQAHCEILMESWSDWAATRELPPPTDAEVHKWVVDFFHRS